jgi:hypothetical protein
LPGQVSAGQEPGVLHRAAEGERGSARTPDLEWAVPPGLARSVPSIVQARVSSRDRASTSELLPELASSTMKKKTRRSAVSPWHKIRNRRPSSADTCFPCVVDRRLFSVTAARATISDSSMLRDDDSPRRRGRDCERSSAFARDREPHSSPVIGSAKVRTRERANKESLLNLIASIASCKPQSTLLTQIRVGIRRGE